MKIVDTHMTNTVDSRVKAGDPLVGTIEGDPLVGTIGGSTEEVVVGSTSV